MGCVPKEKIGQAIMGALEQHVELVKGKNSEYENSDEFLVWVWAGVNQVSVQQASRDLEDLGYDVPSGDTILTTMSNQPYDILEKGFDKIFEDLIAKAKEKQLFDKPVTLAIDYTDIEWYGDELPFIIKSKSKNGTNKFIRFATIAVVEDGKRFTLKVLPVTPLSTKEKVVEELIEFAQELVDIEVILFDRGFYTNKVVEMVKNLKESFIMPVKKQGKAKEKMKDSYLNGPLEYEMSKGAKYTMMTIKDKQKDKLLPYATNLDDKPINVHKFYKSRFGIETQYRVKNKFMGRTCSKKYKIRYTFFVLAVCLYNMWILINISERGKKGLNPDKVPIRVDDLKHMCRKIVYLKSPSSSKMSQKPSETTGLF
ncbi:MAG: transposase [Bacteroidales bacterium]